MNYLFKKLMLCSDNLFLPLLITILNASTSDYIFNAKNNGSIHFLIKEGSQSNEIVLSNLDNSTKINISVGSQSYELATFKKNSSIKFNINQSSLSNYENQTKVDNSPHIKIEQNSRTSYLCNIPMPKKIAKIYINENSISTYLLNGKATPTIYFAFYTSSLSNDSNTMKLTPPLYFSFQASSNSSGVIEQINLKDSIKFGAMCDSLSTTSCLIEMSGFACLNDYSDISLNELDNKTLEDLFYL